MWFIKFIRIPTLSGKHEYLLHTDLYGKAVYPCHARTCELTVIET